MFASITRRARRSLWGTLSFTLIAGAGLAMLLANVQQRGIERDATRQARLTAQVGIAPLLQSRDLQTPAEGSRYESLSSGIETAVLGSGPPQTVTLWGQDGRILFSPNASVVGTKQASMQDLLFSVANGQTTSRVDQGWFQSFVPLWLEPGGTVIVAELDRPYAPIVAQANEPWRVSAQACVVLALASMTLFGLTFRAKAEITTATALAPAEAAESQAPSPRRVPRHEVPIDDSSPAYMLPGYRQEAEARSEAEARAAALEENYYGLQAQYRQALEQLKALDQQVLVQQSSTSQTEGEVELVRDELQQTAQRLHLVEVDRDAVRARLALRESELERLQSKLHTSKLQDALLELDGNSRGGSNGGGSGSASSTRLTLRPPADESDGIAPATRKVG